MNTKNLLKSSLLISTLAVSLFSCKKEDTGKGNQDSGDLKGSFFLATTAEDGASIILNTEQLDTGSISTVGQGIALSYGYTTWQFNKQHKVAFGLYYAQGDPGQGTAYKLAADGTLIKSGADVQIADRFTSYGVFENYLITSVGGFIDSVTTPGKKDTVSVFNFIDVANGNAVTRKTFKTSNLTGNGQGATFSGLVDMGNGEFLMGAVVSGAKPDTAATGGSTGWVQYPDSCWVVAFDKNLNLKRIYRDDRISYASGRFRSQYYSTIALDDQKNAYVFSSSYDATTTRKAGVIRINNGATEFDKSYHWDIQTAAGGYKFRKVWHISGDEFLLEFYNEQVEVITNTTAATQYAVVNVKSKTLNWLADKGFPNKDAIKSVGWLTTYNDKAYIPVNLADGKPTIYIYDTKTGSVTKGMEVDATTISAVGRMSN